MILHGASDNSLFAVSICGFFQHMMKISYDVVKRWINEAQEAASSDNIMVQVRFRGLPQETANTLQGFNGVLEVLIIALEKGTGIHFSFFF